MPRSQEVAKVKMGKTKKGAVARKDLTEVRGRHACLNLPDLS